MLRDYSEAVDQRQTYRKRFKTTLLSKNTEMGEPLVSIITIFLNEEKYLEDAVKSILAQSYANWELLLVDDGSSDRSTEIAKRYAEDHPMNIRYLEHEGHVNKGMSASRNLGIAHARGEFIAFLDADDVYLPNRFEKQVDILKENPDVGMVINPIIHWYEDGRKVPQPLDFFSDKAYNKGELVYKRLDDSVNLTTICGVLIRKKLLEDLGGFEDSFRGYFEDQVAYFKICLHTIVYCNPEYVAIYRIHSKSTSGTLTTRVATLARLRLFHWLHNYQRRNGYAELTPEYFFRTFDLAGELVRRLVDAREFEAALAAIHLLEIQKPAWLKQSELNYNYALCLHNIGIDLQEALHRYNLALENGYNEFLVKFHRGSLHAHLGNVTAAKADLSRALELNPGHEGARKTLESL